MTQPAKLPIFETISSAFGKVQGSKLTFWLEILYYLLAGFFANLVSSIAKGAIASFSIGGILIGGPIYTAANAISWMLLIGLFYLGVQRAEDIPLTHQITKRTFNRRFFFKVISFFFLFALTVGLPVLITFLLPKLIGTGLTHAGIIQLTDGYLHISNWVSIIACSVVGIFLIMRMFLTPAFLAIDIQSSAWSAIKKSFKATKSNVCRLLALTVINLLIYVGSIVFLLVGLIWTMPYFFINYGMVYKRLVTDRLTTI